MKSRYKIVVEVLFLIAICTAIIFIINPRGNFPLNDDWSYSRSVQIYLETSRFELTGWCCVPLLPQVLWGALWCSFTGFSFETLRFSTLLISVIGMIFFYISMIEISPNRFARILLFFVIALNPVYFLLSNTFMTDVPFCAVSMIGLYYYMKYFHTRSTKFLVLAFGFSILSAFFRQIGIFFILSYAILALWEKDKSWLIRVYPIILLILVACGLIIFQKSILSPAVSPFMNNIRMERLFESLSLQKLFGLPAFFKALGMVLIYMGLFLSPVILYFAPNISALVKNKKQFNLIFLIIAVTIFLLLLIAHKLLPFRPNILWSYGLGPATLRDVDTLFIPSIPQIPLVIWALLTFIGISSGMLLGYFLFRFCSRFVRRVKVNTETIFSFENFLILSVILLFLPLCLMEFYDRYLLIFLPLFGLMLLRRFGQNDFFVSKLFINASILLITVIVFFTITASHDYFAMQRTKWRLLDFTMNELHVNPESIDGGFEFNGWYCFDPNYTVSPNKTYWVKDDSFLLTFGCLKDYKIIKSESYSSWLFQKNVPVNLTMKINSTDSHR